MNIKEKSIHTKWAAYNLPMITVYRTDSRLYLTKRELKELYNDIGDFMHYYHDEFLENVIDNVSENFDD